MINVILLQLELAQLDFQKNRLQTLNVLLQLNRLFEE